MDQQQAKQLADRFIEQLHRIEDGNSDGIDTLVDLFADNAELTNSVIDNTHGNLVGRENIARFWREYTASFGEIHSDFFDVTTSDHSAGLFWRSTRTSANGQPMAYEGVSLLMFDDSGKITRFKGYFDSRQTKSKAHIQ